MHISFKFGVVELSNAFISLVLVYIPAADNGTVFSFVRGAVSGRHSIT